MINNQLDDKNIKLTPEQTASLEEYQLRLANLLSEVNNHTKILKGTKAECDRAVKERAYQEELLADLTPKVEEKKKQIDAYNEEINNATTKLSKLQEEIRVKTAKQTELDAEYQDRGNTLSAQEFDSAAKENKLVKIAFDLETDKREFNAKVARLKEVISTF